jgi:DNA mismatch repair protein MutS2
MNEHTAAVLDYPLLKRDLQAYTVTPMGQMLAAQLQPLTDVAVLDVQLQETSEMVALLSRGEEPPLSAVSDIRSSLAPLQIEGFYLEGSQLLEVAACLEVIQRLRRYAQSDTRPTLLLNRRLARLADFGILLRQIRHALDDQGHVRDHASPTLLSVRQTLRHLRERVHTKLRELMARHSAVVQDAIVTIRHNRFVVPLKADFHQVIRGIVHGESASGATVYVEPDSAVELNNQILHTQAEEERAVREVLRELTSRLAVQRVVLAQTLQILGEIDFILAKGRLSLRLQGSAPRFVSHPQLSLVAARHPLLSTPIPIDVRLGPECSTLVVTGPNTGGKTAVLKTVGLLALMAQSGLHIPASPESTLPIFTEIFVDLGDEQSLLQNLSTFSAHLANICTMMQQVSAHSLVLLDELGAGTDPMEGGPLGIALLEYFHQSGAMTLVTTHHSAIKAFAMTIPQIACAAVDFDLDTLEPRYQLIYGLPGQSKAFAIAHKLGVPSAVISRAQQEAGMTQVRSEQLLARLELRRQELEEEHQRLHAERHEIARSHEAARQILEQAKAEEHRIRQKLYAEGQALLKTARQDLDITLAAVRRQAPTAESIAFPQETWQRVVDMVASLEPMVAEVPAPEQPLQVGEQVWVRALKVIGRLRTPVEGHSSVQVEIGNKTITVSPAALERADASHRQTPAAPSGPVRPARGKTPPAQEGMATELRLLGYTVEEALPVVEKYLDQAFTQGVPRLRIVHGVGSGRLRDAITDLLSRHPLVRRFQAGDIGGGTTTVELER